jgi:hypothetical protein
MRVTHLLHHLVWTELVSLLILIFLLWNSTDFSQNYLLVNFNVNFLFFFLFLALSLPQRRNLSN